MPGDKCCILIGTLRKRGRNYTLHLDNGRILPLEMMTNGDRYIDRRVVLQGVHHGSVIRVRKIRPYDEAEAAKPPSWLARFFGIGKDEG